MNTPTRPRLVATLTALSAALAFTGPAPAQNQTRAQPATASTVQVSEDLDVRASRLIGMDVYNLQGRKLGTVEDLVIDFNNIRLHYVVLGVGGVLGVGEKLVPYPAKRLQIADNRVLVDLSPQRLDQAPSFKRTQWPDWTSARYREQLARFHGAGSAPPNPPDLRLVRASELIGRDVNDQQGRDAGEIEDLVITLRPTQVHYVVLDVDKAWNPDDKLLALPLDTLSLPASGQDDAVLNVPRDKLDLSQGFDDDRWPDINDAQYRERLDRELRTYHVFSSSWKPQGDVPATPAPR